MVFIRGDRSMSGGYSDPAISIIVPVYKVEAYLDRCMETLLGQTFSDIEIILVDDGSPDRCPEMCDAYAAKDPRVKVIHKANGGLGFARNSGLDVASGEYVCFVDSDDYVMPEMCEKLYKKEQETVADIVYGGILYRKADGSVKPADNGRAEIVWKGEEEIKQLLLDFVATKPGRTKDTVMEVSVWRALFRRKLLEENGIRFVSERQFISEDVIFDVDILQECRCVAAIPDPVYYYCTNPGSLTKTFREDRFQKVLELYHELLRRLAPLYSEEECRLRCGRFLLARVRRNAMSIIRQRKTVGRTQMRRWLADICENEDVRQVLSEYPIEKLPYQQFAAAWLMKGRHYLLLEMLLSLKRG